MGFGSELGALSGSRFSPAVVMFGSPGSGKGTQSRFLVEWLGIPQISTGDMLRDHMRRGTEIGRDIAGLMKSGSLVADQLVNELVRNRIAEKDCANGFILDGYPRTMEQAGTLLPLLAGIGMFEVVIHLAVDYNIVVTRMTGRRVCPQCGTLYNALSRPPRRDGLCDLDGAQLAIRDDDREDVVRQRLEQYEARTRPLIDYFRGSGARMFEVDASRERPEAVFERIRNAFLEFVPALATGSVDAVGDRALLKGLNR